MITIPSLFIYKSVVQHNSQWAFNETNLLFYAYSSCQKHLRIFFSKNAEVATKAPLHNFAGFIHSSQSLPFSSAHTAELSDRDIRGVSFLQRGLNSLPSAEVASLSITI